MIRTAFVALGLAVVAARAAVAAPQEPAAAAKAQADRIDELVASMRAAEARLETIVLELTTTSRLPGDVTVTTRGELRVARGAQAAIHTRFVYEFADGLRGRSECAQTADGIVLYEEDAAFGEVYVRVDPVTAADLEWAGRVLRRDDLPGMAAAGPRHADAPLGSAMVAAMQRQFVLAIDARTERDGEPGTWLAGARQPGLDVQGGLPVADRVELFVRARDLALVSVRQFVGDAVVQELTVTRAEPGASLVADDFTIRGVTARLQPVQDHRPLWEQIEQATRDAEARRLSAWSAAVAMWGVGGGPPLFLLAVRPSQR